MRGEIPSELGNLESLQNLDLRKNSRLLKVWILVSANCIVLINIPLHHIF